MTTALQTTAPVVTDQQITLIRQTIAKDATDQEFALFLYDNARRNAHPLDKLIHFTKRKGKYTPITGIDFMRSQASDSGEYAGNDDAVFSGDEKKPNATVTVWRLVGGQRCSFSATARWSEYYPAEAFMWNKMPHTMIAKCAEALALRKGFPQQLAGLYSSEEMDQAGPMDVGVTEGEIVNSAPPTQRKTAPTAPIAKGWYRVVSVTQKEGTRPTRYEFIDGDSVPLKAIEFDGKHEGAAQQYQKAETPVRLRIDTRPGKPKKDGGNWPDENHLTGITHLAPKPVAGMTSVSELARAAEPETVLGSPVLDDDEPPTPIDDLLGDVEY